MNTIDVHAVEVFVKGALHSIKLVEAHLKRNNQHAAEIELINAKSELNFLLKELERSKS